MEEDKTIEEKDQQEEQQESEEGVKKRSLPINIIVGAILVLCLIGGGFFIWKGDLFAKLSSKNSDESSSLDPSKDIEEIGPIYALDNFIVNLLGGQGKNYLKARIELELSNDSVLVEVNKRLPQIRDSVLTMLSSKTHDDIKTLEGKFQLRAELISMLNQFLRSGKIRNIYFTDFIVQ